MHIANSILLFILSLQLQAQPSRYTTSKAHSHNDYEQQLPFQDAYNHGFGSIEADIFLLPGNSHLLVAHSVNELTITRRTLDSLYLDPLVKCLKINNGFPYADTSKTLQILVDIKTDATSTLEQLIKTLQRYPLLLKCERLRFVISGNRPDSDSFYYYTRFVKFDGELSKAYSTNALKHIALLSDNFKNYSDWDGKSELPDGDKRKIVAAINKAHSFNKPVRFWNAPDNTDSWTILMNLGVDYLNTDHIELLAEFLSSKISSKK